MNTTNTSLANKNTPTNLLTPLAVGDVVLRNRLIVAPMAGVTDNPFRRLCKSFGAGHAISEMMTTDKALYAKQKSLFRANFDGEIAPICAQIAGADPKMMAQAARYQVQNGAQIIDINMGCPAKKVCKKQAGSALLANPDLVRQILCTVVDSVDVPVTLKTRLGFCRDDENILHISQIAQDAGIQMLTIHGRTRDDGYSGQARYKMIAEVKAHSKIPIIANGDIDSVDKALEVVQATGADGVMIGRAAQGAPWLFRQIIDALQGFEVYTPTRQEIGKIALAHLQEIYRFYGEYSGCRIARKHIAWYTQSLPDSAKFRQMMYEKTSTAEQYSVVQDFFALHDN